MDFQIVKYKKRQNFEYEVVPSAWAIGTKVYFPRNNMSSMIRDPDTKPDVNTWLSYQMVRIKRAGYGNYNDAVSALERMLEESTTDTEAHTKNDEQPKTRSKKHCASHSSNRLLQLQMPPVFQHVTSKVRSNNFQEVEVEEEPKTPEVEVEEELRTPEKISNTEEYLDDYEEPVPGPNSSLYQYQLPEGRTSGMHQYVVVGEVNSQPETPVHNNAGTLLSGHTNLTTGETIIIGQLKNLTSKIIDLANAVNIIMSSIETCPQKTLKNEPTLNKILTEEKPIKNEADLRQFEQQPDEIMKQLRLEILIRIGKRQPTEVRSCCLELSDLLIAHDFWQYTSWAGGTKNETKPKFALQEHHIFLDFFKDIVRETTDACFSDRDFASFFQSKMKNRNQIPTKHKRGASRNRHPKKQNLQTSCTDVGKFEDIEEN